jgi:hypothetical protein
MQSENSIILEMCLHENADYYSLESDNKKFVWDKMSALYNTAIKPFVSIKENSWDHYSDLPSVESYDRQEKCWVLVECIDSFRMRYLVQTPIDHPEYALDTVICNEAKEFGQFHLDELIVSHRVISEKEALQLCREEHSYLSNLSDEKMKDMFFTYDPDLVK